MATLVGIRLRECRMAGDADATVGWEPASSPCRCRWCRMAGDADATVGLVLDLPEPEALLGRSPYLGATVLLHCDSVAKCHARIWRTGDGYAIEDLGSRNGTFVNGARLVPDHPVALGDGAEVRFANVLTFIFRAGPDPGEGGGADAGGAG